MSLPQKPPEVPLLPGHPPQLRNFLVEVRKTLIQLQGTVASPGLPLNLKVTPQAFSNTIQWSRGYGADYHEVLWNTVPTVNNANVVPVQNGQQWTHNVGQSGQKFYYWVRAVKQAAPHAITRTIELGPIAGTTLASNAGVAPPVPPPSGVNQVLDQRTGGREPL